MVFSLCFHNILTFEFRLPFVNIFLSFTRIMFNFCDGPYLCFCVRCFTFVILRLSDLFLVVPLFKFKSWHACEFSVIGCFFSPLFQIAILQFRPFKLPFNNISFDPRITSCARFGIFQSILEYNSKNYIEFLLVLRDKCFRIFFLLIWFYDFNFTNQTV